MKRILIRNGWIVTMDNENRIIRNGCIEIKGKNIQRIFSDESGVHPEEYDQVLDASHMVVLPGLIDIHTHVCGSLFKGMLEDTPNGFYGKALPMEDRLTPEWIYRLSLLGAAECLMGGITMINDLYHGMECTAQALLDLGMRGVVATKIFETDLARIQYRDYTRNRAAGQRRLEENIALIEKFHGKGDGRILCKFGPHATDTVSLELAKRIALLGEKYNVGFHIHAAQMPQEVSFLKEEYGLTPIEYLCESGLMGKRTTVAHCLHVSDSDIRLLASGGATLAHCPDMNGNKGGPLAPMDKMYAAGVSVGYGTDWTSSDLFSTMRMGITVGRLFGGSQAHHNALDALRRCTIDAARHLEVDRITGSLEEGKRADMVLVDLRKAHLCPVHDDPVSTVVYNANCNDVHSVLVDGKLLVEGGRLRSMDLDDIMNGAQEAADYIRKC